jgi:hypothetical protein
MMVGVISLIYVVSVSLGLCFVLPHLCSCFVFLYMNEIV